MTQSPANPVKGEVDMAFNGAAYRFTFDWEEICAYEAETNSSFLDLMVALEVASKGGPLPQLRHLAAFMQAGLRKHHDTIDPQQAVRMVMDQGVRAAAMQAVGAAMPSKPESDGEDGDDETPGEPVPAGRSAGSRKSLPSGSKQAGAKPRSGKPRRG